MGSQKWQARRLFYCNASFDLGLSGCVVQRYRHLFDEMTLWFLPVGTHFDKIVIACRVPQDYADYYGSFGLELPSAVTAGDDCADMQGVAW
ncbi:MAG: hypothetical protein GY868_20885, partial [Deltaproteobacteria bacterium]|nr:hypothetical protein [Deltaproteobacteria bacterium]